MAFKFVKSLTYFNKCLWFLIKVNLLINVYIHKQILKINKCLYILIKVNKINICLCILINIKKINKC